MKHRGLEQLVARQFNLLEVVGSSPTPATKQDKLSLLKTMEQLKLRINKKHFQAILKGEEKVEERFIYPNNAEKYVTEEENPDGTVNINPIPYDRIQFIQGRGKDAPKLTIEVKESKFVILTDEQGNDLTYEENGETYVVCQVWYTLGEILSTENLED